MIYGWDATAYLKWPATIAEHRVTTNFCLSAWVYYGGTTARNQYIFSKSIPSVANRWSFVLQINTSKQAGLSISPNGTGTSVVSVTSGTISSNVWTHILAGRDHANSVLRMYINSVARDAVASSDPAFDATGSALTVGARENNTSQCDFPIFDAKIIPVAPNQALADLVYGARGRDGLSTVLRTCIADACVGAGSLSGKKVYDHSPYRNHITATGAPTAATDPFNPFPNGDK